MNNIEIIVCLLLLFMAVPDLCRKLRRPALAYAVFVLFGLVAGPLVDTEVRTMLQQAGELGFLLLLFEVGLEIDLPPVRQIVRPLHYAIGWAALQYPPVVVLALAGGLSWSESLVAAAALTGCSVGMAHAAWKHHPAPSEEARAFVLQVMVVLEMLAIVLLSVETVTLKSGFGWMVLLKLAGITITILLISRFAVHLARLFQTILEKTTHWRLHFLVLLILGVCAVGERLGLSAVKTAFFLGLFMSRARHAGLKLEDHMAPLSKRFLIPLFFVALGLQIHWQSLFTWLALLAVGAGFLLLGFREVIHRRWLPTGGNAQTYLLLCPNLTIVALAASALLRQADRTEAASWLLLTGLFVTVPALLLLPAAESNGATPAAPTDSPENHSSVQTAGEKPQAG